MFKEKTKILSFDVDHEFSDWLNAVSAKVGVTREQITKEAIEAWITGKIVIA